MNICEKVKTEKGNVHKEKENIKPIQFKSNQDAVTCLYRFIHGKVFTLIHFTMDGPVCSKVVDSLLNFT